MSFNFGDMIEAVERATPPGRIALARFFADNIAPGAAGLEVAVMDGGASLREGEAALAN